MAGYCFITLKLNSLFIPGHTTQLCNAEVAEDDATAHSIQELTMKAGFTLQSGPDIERDTVVHVYSACNDCQRGLVNSNSPHSPKFAVMEYM